MTPQGKSLLTTLTLLLAAGGTGLYAYYGVKKPEEAREAAKAVDQSLFRANAAGAQAQAQLQDGGSGPGSEEEAIFTELSVKAKGETTRLEKQGDSWFLVEPLKAKAEAFTVEAILGQLRMGKIKREVEEKPSEEELVRFGLKPPQFIVSAKAHVPDGTGGGKEDSARTRQVTLYGGVENSFDGSVYLQREGDPKVYAADGALRQALEKDAFDLRDKEALAFDDKAIRRLTFKAGARGYTLERQDFGAESGWKLPDEPADAAVVTGMLSSFKGQRALAFPKPSPSLDKAWDKPAAEVTLALSEGEPLIFRFIKTKPEGKSIVLRQQGNSRLLAEVPPEAIAALDRDVKELRDRTVTGVKAAQVARVAFKPAGSDPAVVVERSPSPSSADGGSSEEWEVIAPEKKPAAKFKVASALWSLEALKASSIVEDKAKDPGKYGFGPAARSVSLYGAAGKALARVELGKEVPNRPQMRYVRGARGQVLEVEASKLDPIPSSLAAVLPDPPGPASTDAGTDATPPALPQPNSSRD